MLTLLKHVYTVRVKREFAENATVTVGASSPARAVRLAMKAFPDALAAAVLLDEVQQPL